MSTEWPPEKARHFIALTRHVAAGIEGLEAQLTLLDLAELVEAIEGIDSPAAEFAERTMARVRVGCAR